MEPAKIEGFTREIGKPRNWDDERDGECGALAVRDVVEGRNAWMVSAWTPSADELAALNAGRSVLLWIGGQVHPVVSVAVSQDG